jgi:hypothetical protein
MRDKKVVFARYDLPAGFACDRIIIVNANDNFASVSLKAAA